MLVLAIFAIPICISDWRYRRIPNIYLIYMLYLIFAIRLLSPLESIAVMSIAILCAYIFSLAGMGAGDAKLFVITVLALNLPNYRALLLLALCMYISTIVQVILMWLFSSHMPKSVPLAFALFSGTAPYLAADTSTFLRQYADALVNSW